MPIKYIPYYLSVTQCFYLKEECRKQLESLPLKHSGRSRVRRWGWDYLDLNHWLGEIPIQLVTGNNFLSDSVTLNEYSDGRRIGPHIDSLGYDDDIYVISLGDPGTIIFHEEPEKRLQLDNGSLLHFWGRERTHIKHSTEPCEGLRYSLVFRNKRT